MLCYNIMYSHLIYEDNGLEPHIWLRQFRYNPIIFYRLWLRKSSGEEAVCCCLKRNVKNSNEVAT